jgi:hypothetical protein
LTGQTAPACGGLVSPLGKGNVIRDAPQQISRRFDHGAASILGQVALP